MRSTRFAVVAVLAALTGAAWSQPAAAQDIGYGGRWFGSANQNYSGYDDDPLLAYRLWPHLYSYQAYPGGTPYYGGYTAQYQYGYTTPYYTGGYGQPSVYNGLPRYTYYPGYYRGDGTYVRPHYRSR